MKYQSLNLIIPPFAVTPYTGVWIEIQKDYDEVTEERNVTPYTGVWIEISTAERHAILLARHSLYGSVD